MIHTICLLVHLCGNPHRIHQPDDHPPIVTPVEWEDYWRKEGFAPPSEEEPDGHIPLGYIFRYDEWGQLPLPFSTPPYSEYKRGLLDSHKI